MVNLAELPIIFELLKNFESKMRQNPRNTSFLKDCDIQCNFNIPILLLTALHINEYCEHQKLNRILFCSRDCYYLVKIFDTLFKNKFKSIYFYTSRISRIYPTEAYKNFCLSLISDKSLVVDLCGTGNSLGHLYKSLKIQPKTFFLHFIEQNEKEGVDSLGKFNRSEIKTLSYLLKGKVFNNIYIEISNYSPDGMLLDMKYLSAENKFAPIFNDPKYPNEIAVRIDNFKYLFDLFLESIKLLDINDLINEQLHNSNLVKKIIETLYEGLTMQEANFSDFFYYHFKELKDVEKLIKLKDGGHPSKNFKFN
jgi:hypothetical protein